MSNGNAGGAPGAGGTPPQNPAPGSGGTPPAQAGGDWTSGLNDDLKGFVQTKGFKDPAAVLESYRNFEKLQGVPQERLLRLPEKFDMSAPETRAVFERLGAPKEAKDYNIEIPKEHGDENLANWFKDIAHKNGFTHAQAEGLTKAWNENVANSLKAENEAADLKWREQEENLKKEWGGAFDQNTNIAKAGAKAFGIGEAEMDALGDALGYDKAMNLLHKLGAGSGEHEFVGGTPPGRGPCAYAVPGERPNQ